MMVVVMGTLWCIHRQQQIVRPQPVPLSVGIRKDPRLHHLVFRVIDSWNYNSRTEGQHLILGKDVVDILVEHHLTNRLNKRKPQN